MALNLAFRSFFDEATETVSGENAELRPSVRDTARTSLPKVGEVGTEPESPEVEKDKTRILNAITGAEFDATPDLNHPAFGRVNKFLRSQIIANGHQQLVAAGQMGEVIDCVCADSGRTTLALVLREQEELRDLAAVGAVGNLPALTSLRLDFAFCSQLADVSALGSAVGNLQALTSLHLDFGYCSQLADVSALGSAVGTLQALTSLHLDFYRCSKLSRKLREKFDSKEDFLAALEA